MLGSGSRRIAILALSMALACLACHAGSVLVNGRGPVLDLGRNLKWGVAGSGGIEKNAFIFSPTSPNTGVCISLLNNNASTAHAATTIVYQTSDQSVTSFVPTSLQRWTTTAAASSITVNFGTPAVQWVQTAGAARVAVYVSGTTAGAGTPDTADLFVTESANGCGGQGVQGGIGPAAWCTSWFAVDIPSPSAGAWNALFPLPAAALPSIGSIHLCHASFASSAPQDIALGTAGTGTANCAGAVTQMTGKYPAVSSLSLEWPNDAFKTAYMGPLCIWTGGASGVHGLLGYSIY